eukprot:symbB.v1.2.032681.t1/scaffold3957.1/size47491/3
MEVEEVMSLTDGHRWRKDEILANTSSFNQRSECSVNAFNHSSELRPTSEEEAYHESVLQFTIYSSPGAVRRELE